MGNTNTYILIDFIVNTNINTRISDDINTLSNINTLNQFLTQNKFLFENSTYLIFTSLKFLNNYLLYLE